MQEWWQAARGDEVCAGLLKVHSLQIQVQIAAARFPHDDFWNVAREFPLAARRRREVMRAGER